MTKHTSGPWQLEGFNIRISDKSYYLLNNQASLSAGELRANSNLIAAAPELLEALKMASDFLNYGEAMHSSKLVYDIIEVAIAKAEGNTN